MYNLKCFQFQVTTKVKKGLGIEHLGQTTSMQNVLSFGKFLESRGTTESDYYDVIVCFDDQ